MSGILRQWPLSLHRKTSKLLNMALILPILKKKYIFYQFSIGGHLLSYNFCCKMETVDFFCENLPNTPKCPYMCRVKLKSALKTSDFDFLPFVTKILCILNLKFFHFSPCMLVLKLKMPPRMQIIIFEFFVLIKYSYLLFPY